MYHESEEKNIVNQSNKTTCTTFQPDTYRYFEDTLRAYMFGLHASNPSYSYFDACIQCAEFSSTEAYQVRGLTFRGNPIIVTEYFQGYSSSRSWVSNRSVTPIPNKQKNHKQICNKNPLKKIFTDPIVEMILGLNKSTVNQNVQLKQRSLMIRKQLFESW